MWVVKRLERFEVEVSGLVACSDDAKTFVKLDTGKAIGFLPVYDTVEDARAEYPDADLFEIALVVTDKTTPAV